MAGTECGREHASLPRPPKRSRNRHTINDLPSTYPPSTPALAPACILRQTLAATLVSLPSFHRRPLLRSVERLRSITLKRVSWRADHHLLYACSSTDAIRHRLPKAHWRIVHSAAQVVRPVWKVDGQASGTCGIAVVRAHRYPGYRSGVIVAAACVARCIARIL